MRTISDSQRNHFPVYTGPTKCFSCELSSQSLPRTILRLVRLCVSLIDRPIELQITLTALTSIPFTRFITIFCCTVHRHSQSGVSGVERLIRPLRGLVGLSTDAKSTPAARSTSTPVFSSAESMASRTRVIGQVQRHERLVGAATRVMSSGPRPVPPVRTKRAMINVRHHVELERPPSQLPGFRGAGTKVIDASGKWAVARVPNTSGPGAGLREWTPSSQPSRGSFRSDLSGTSSAIRRHASHFTPLSKSSHRLPPHSFVQNISPLSSYAHQMEQMRSASAATLTGPSLTDLSFGYRPVSALEQSPVARPSPSPFPRSEGSISYEQHIYQNQMQLMGRPSDRQMVMQSAHSSSSSPFARTLLLRDSQRRRFDHRIAQIRRERESTRIGRIRPQVSITSVLTTDPPAASPPPLPPQAPDARSPSSLSSDSDDERLCQV